MSDESTRTSTMPLALSDEVREPRQILPGELFGDRQAWRPRSELHPEGETTRLIKFGVLVVLFFCYLTAGVIFLRFTIDNTSLSGTLALIFGPPLFAVIVCVLTAWVLLPGMSGRSVGGRGKRDR